ncbi:MAG: DUF86 domain-containing protein [Rhodospirillales bacterium]
MGLEEKRGNPSACLEDMQASCEAILIYTAGFTAEDFSNDLKTIDAVLRRLEVLGEAAGRLLRLAEQAGSAYAGLPLRTAYDMRNALIHGYDGVDVGVVWQTVTRDIPPLLEAISAELIRR